MGRALSSKCARLTEVFMREASALGHCCHPLGHAEMREAHPSPLASTSAYITSPMRRISSLSSRHVNVCGRLFSTMRCRCELRSSKHTCSVSQHSRDGRAGAMCAVAAQVGVARPRARTSS